MIERVDVRTKLGSLGVPTTLNYEDAEDLRWSHSNVRPGSKTPTRPAETIGAEPPAETTDSFGTFPRTEFERLWRVRDHAEAVRKLSLLASMVLATYYGKGGGNLRVLWKFTVAGVSLRQRTRNESAPSDELPGRRTGARIDRAQRANEQAEAILAYAHLLWNLIGSREPPWTFAPGDTLYGGLAQPRWYELASARKRVGPSRFGANRLRMTLERIEQEEGVVLIHEQRTTSGNTRPVVCAWTLWKLFPDAFVEERARFAQAQAFIEAWIEYDATVAVEPCIASRFLPLLKSLGPPPSVASLRKGRRHRPPGRHVRQVIATCKEARQSFVSAEGATNAVSNAHGPQCRNNGNLRMD